jgi:hypothetical protein
VSDCQKVLVHTKQTTARGAVLTRPERLALGCWPHGVGLAGAVAPTTAFASPWRVFSQYAGAKKTCTKAL